MKYDLEKKKGFLEGQVLFEDAYRKNARLLSEIRLRSFRSNSEGGGSCFWLGDRGEPEVLDEEEGVLVNIGILLTLVTLSNRGMYFNSGFNSDLFFERGEFCNKKGINY